MGIIEYELIFHHVRYLNCRFVIGYGTLKLKPKEIIENVLYTEHLKIALNTLK